jgi:hypothetical protein
MDEAEHRQVVSELGQSLQQHRYAKGTAGELIGRFGYSELRPDVAEYVERMLNTAGLMVKPSLAGAQLDTKVKVSSAKQLELAVVISEEPAAFVARLAMVVGKQGYILHSQSDENAIFNREETKWVGIARGGTKKYVKTIVVQFSSPNNAGQRTAAVHGEDGSLAPAIRQAAAGQ